MRNRTAVVLALVMTAASLYVPPGTAQTAAPATEFTTHVAEDITSDVKVCDATVCQPAPGGRFGPTDLKSLDVQETNEGFSFILGVATLSPSPAEIPGAESGRYAIMFQNFDRQFRLNIQRFTFGGTQYAASLQALDPARHGYFTVTNNPQDIEVKEDLTANTVTATLKHRDLLVDGHGAAPHPEVPFTGFHATAAALSNNIQFGRAPGAGGQKLPVPTATDAMPDSQNSTLNGGAMPIHFGVLQSGHARLKADIPARSSNGEATTFVYEVLAMNMGASEDHFNLLTIGVDPTWQVKLPADQVVIPGNGTLRLLILVTTPFAHQHGKFVNFLLEMHSVSDPATVGRIQLGVRYAQPPQPAGHHPQLWLHSTSAGTDPTTVALQTLFPGQGGVDNEAYMNAETTDPNDNSVDVPGDLVCDDLPVGSTCDTPSGSQTPTTHYRWEIPLSPGLDMGLDFDMADKGSNLNNVPPAINFKIATTLPLNNAVLSGRLVHYAAATGPVDPFGNSFGNATVVATLETTPAVNVPQQSAAFEFNTKIHSAPGGDFVPFQKGASLVLQLDLNFTRVDNPFGPHDVPKLTPGGTLTLPLFEYHDPVSDIYLSTVELVATSKADRFVNPGKTALFNITLVNHGNKEGSFIVDMTGTHGPLDEKPWARLLAPSATLTVPANGSVAIAVAVNVPADAKRPDAADLVITAASQSDPNQRSLLHLYAVVDTDHDYPDESAAAEILAGQQGAKAKTPGFELLALVAALGVVAMALRRRDL